MNNTKSAVQTAFITLYRKQSFNKMSVKSLCMQVPIARTTFYEYYDNLHTLKAEIEDRLIGEMLDLADTIADGFFSEMNLHVFLSQSMDYNRFHWEENYAFLIAQP